MIKAILIDPVKEEISEIDFELTGWKSIVEKLECELFEVHPFPDEHDEYFYLDEEGLLKPNYMWNYRGTNQPFGGRGLIIAIDNVGNEISTRLNLEDVKDAVSFLGEGVATIGPSHFIVLED